MSYPSDLSDKQWQRIERFFGRPDPRGARFKYAKRRVVEAILYRLREGCRWRALPHDFPPWDMVYDHWRRWQKRDVWPEAVAVLGTRWREVALGRSRRAPRHAILDSQAVKTATEGDARGLHGGKKVKGRARHVAVDSQGTLLAVHVCAANKADGAEAGTVMVQACERHPSLESFTADTAYKRRAEHVACEQLGVELHITAKPKKQKPSRCRIKRGRLQARRVPLAGRAHLRVARPVPPALQRIRKDRRVLRGVALVRDDAVAPAPTCRLTQQLLLSIINIHRLA